MLRQETLAAIPPIDILLVLGRGINANGELNQTSIERAQIASELARILLPRVVDFTGGNSWRQNLSGIALPLSEGEAMYNLALEYGGQPPAGVRYVYETRSMSTVANMILSRPLINARPGEQIGILSDELHFTYHRVQDIAARVFPDNSQVAIKIPRLLLPGDLREEQFTAIATRTAMLGLRPGNYDGMMRRQHYLENLNAAVRKFTGVTGRPDELEVTSQPVSEPLEQPAANVLKVTGSYTDLAAYRNMSIAHISGAIVRSMAA